MTRKTIKTVKHFIEKPRKRNSEDEPQAGPDSQVTYADALAHLETSLAHLQTLSHSFILSLKNSEQVGNRNPGTTGGAMFVPFTSKPHSELGKNLISAVVLKVAVRGSLVSLPEGLCSM